VCQSDEGRTPLPPHGRPVGRRQSGSGDQTLSLALEGLRRLAVVLCADDPVDLRAAALRLLRLPVPPGRLYEEALGDLAGPPPVSTQRSCTHHPSAALAPSTGVILVLPPQAWVPGRRWSGRTRS